VTTETSNEENTMPRIDEGRWLGADEQHREWSVAIYGDGDFSDEGVTLGRRSPHRIHAESDRDRMLGEISDEDEHWQAEQRSEVIWRSVGPWQAGEPPVDGDLHRVTVTVENVWIGAPGAPERDIEFHHAVEHPAACHLLPYGAPCEFDLVTNHGDDHMPGHPGVYDARVVEEEIPDGVDPDLAFAEFRVDYERVQQAPGGGAL
jgi:hypothetical protein